MPEPLWAIILRPEHPWELGERLAEAIGEGLADLAVRDLFRSAWRGDLMQSMERLQIEASGLPVESQVLLWSGLALHVRIDDDSGAFRACLAHCREADAAQPCNAARLLPGLLEGHWQSARKRRSEGIRLGDALASGRLLDHHQALQLALRGLASPLLRDHDLLMRLARSDAAWIERLRFYDAVECGRVGEAADLAGRPALHHAQAEGPLIRAYTALTWIQQAVLGRHLPDPARTLDGPSAPWRHIGQPHLERSVRAVFASVIGRREDLATLAALPVTDDELFTPSCHFAVLPIRIALANGQPERAGELLARRRAAGVATYLDRALGLRRLLQQGDRGAAAAMAATLGRDLSAWDCRARVEFELRAAGELALCDLALLAGEQIQPAAPTPVPIAGHGLVGSSAAMTRVRAAVERFAGVELPVLVRGPSGTGKDLVARALHDASPRRKQPFVAVNCASLAEGLLESELFGHARGAFSGAAGARTGLVAAAGDGTLFLDEIGEISRHFQATLLRLLEYGDYRPVGSDASRRIRARIVAATNADLGRMVADGSFREDLFHRLCRLEIALPPLADHPEDIDELVPHLLERARGGRPATAAPALLDLLRQRRWQGNVRELRNRLESMVVLHPHLTRYGVDAFAAVDGGGASVPVLGTTNMSGQPVLPEDGKLQRLEALRRLLRERGRITRVEAARELGISPMTATVYLRGMCTEGSARKVMPNPAPRSHYFVAVTTT
jgi:DNA-binding NtrC family response regulator